MAVDFDDNVFIYGPNYFGECGLGTQGEIFEPTLVPDIKAKMVSCGAIHTMILTTNNELYASGNNEYGQCGLPETITGVARFTKVDSVNFPVKYVQSQTGYTLIIDHMNNLYCLGTSPLSPDNRGLIKISPGCNRVSGTSDYFVFTDMNDNVYFFGKIIKTRFVNGWIPFYTAYDSKGIKLIPNIKARKIEASYRGPFTVIGTRINLK